MDLGSESETPMANNFLCVPYIFDLEVTNLCNTECAFCPRKAITRPKGRMNRETFEWFLKRLKLYVQKIEGQIIHLPHEKASVRAGRGEESPVRVLMCGMGECLTHPETPEWIGRIRSEVGVRASIVTNGALLDEAMMRRLITARVTVIIVSVPGVSRETYSRTMKLDWDTVIANVRRASEMLPGRIEVSVTIPRDAGFTAQDVVAFWSAFGGDIRISAITPCHNRGGFMTDERLLSSEPQRPSRFCGVLARHFLTAWDGRVLSCCHDLRGENVIGDIRTDEYADLARRKTAMMDPGPCFAICPRCDDPQRPDRSAIAGVQRQVLLPEGQ